uniref:Uncharacterized protein n=1 Tax=Oryza meridionalis TaxID=40149 RepID=A0A0E0D6T0_9ORYZ
MTVAAKLPHRRLSRSLSFEEGHRHTP